MADAADFFLKEYAFQMTLRAVPDLGVGVIEA
jgi:hypothetical protein